MTLRERIDPKEMRRRFLGVELKRSYWEQAVRNLGRAAIRHDDLFGAVADTQEQEA